MRTFLPAKVLEIVAVANQSFVFEEIAQMAVGVLSVVFNNGIDFHGLLVRFDVLLFRFLPILNPPREIILVVVQVLCLRPNNTIPITKRRKGDFHLKVFSRPLS